MSNPNFPALSAHQMGFSIPETDIHDIYESVHELTAHLADISSTLTMDHIDTCFQTILLKYAKSKDEFKYTFPLGHQADHTSEYSIDKVFQNIESSELAKLAWVRLNHERALKTAETLEKLSLEEQHKLPLYNIPLGLKDMFAQKEQTHLCGSIIRGDSPPSTISATLVERLEGAGAITVGALHMSEFAMSPTGYNMHLGPGINPHDASRITGGSSSGSGMVVGAKHVPLSIGSDTGGSIRIPAAYCGTYGLKPTQYYVSAHGSMPLSPSLDCSGPLAIDLELCARAFAVIAGRDDRDNSSLDAPAPQLNWKNIKSHDLTLAIPKLPTDIPVSNEIREVFAQVSSDLQAAGIKCVEIELPDLSTYGKLASIITATESTAVHREALLHTPEKFGRHVRRRVSRGIFISAIDYYDALRARPLILNHFMQTYMEGIDGMLLPVVPDIAPLITDVISEMETVVENKFAITYWTRGINYLGLPALTVPVCKSKEGLPIGLQIVGRPLGEDELFAIAKFIDNKQQ